MFGKNKIQYVTIQDYKYSQSIRADWAFLLVLSVVIFTMFLSLYVAISYNWTLVPTIISMIAIVKSLSRINYHSKIMELSDQQDRSKELEENLNIK